MNTQLIIGRVQLNTTDIIILCLACLLTFWLYSTFWFTNDTSGKAETVIIQMADNIPVEYSLKEDRIIDIEGRLGKSLIEIKQGKARFIHSACRNQFCVFHGWLTTAGDTTACLPNQISMTLKGHLNEYDALAGGR